MSKTDELRRAVDILGKMFELGERDRAIAAHEAKQRREAKQQRKEEAAKPAPPVDHRATWLELKKAGRTVEAAGYFHRHGRKILTDDEILIDGDGNGPKAA